MTLKLLKSSQSIAGCCRWQLLLRWQTKELAETINESGLQHWIFSQISCRDFNNSVRIVSTNFEKFMASALSTRYYLELTVCTEHKGDVYIDNHGKSTKRAKSSIVLPPVIMAASDALIAYSTKRRTNSAHLIAGSGDTVLSYWKKCMHDPLAAKLTLLFGQKQKNKVQKFSVPTLKNIESVYPV